MPSITRRWNKKEIVIRTLGKLVAQGVYVEGPGFGVGIGRPAYGERRYRGDYAYAGPRFYSERRYHRGPHVLERHSYRWRGRDWD